MTLLKLIKDYHGGMENTEVHRENLRVSKCPPCLRGKIFCPEVILKVRVFVNS